MEVFTDNRQTKVLEKIKEWFKTNKPDPLHDIDHSIRDAYWAKLLSEKEGADPNIVIPAAFLHDMAIPKVGDEFHARVGAKMCKPILRECGYTKKEIERISETILMHSTDDPQPKPPATIEGKVMFDADKLDAVGPITLHRWFFEYQRKGFLNHEVVRKILDHLEKWKKKYGNPPFYTETAKKICKERIKYIEKICKGILKDAEKFKEFYKLI